MADPPHTNGWMSRTFAATRQTPAEVRSALDALFDRSAVDDDVYADIRLLVSELVMNAVMHSGTDEVCLTVRPGDPVRVGVRDRGDGYPRLNPDKAVGGFGLQLVDELSSQWGVEPLPRGKVVWFDMPLSTSRRP